MYKNANLSSRGVLLQPVVYLGHHRRMSRLHCAAGQKQIVMFHSMGPFLNIIHSVVNHFIFSASREDTCNPKAGIKTSALGHIFPIQQSRTARFNVHARLKALLLFFTFSVPTCSGTLPSLQSVEKGY